MVYEEFEQMMKKVHIGCNVIYRDDINSSTLKKGIVTGIIQCHGCSRSRHGCPGKIKIDNKTPDCLVYSSHHNKSLIVEVIESDFIEEGDFKV